MTGVRLHDYGCTLKAYRSEVLKEFRLYGEQHRFIPALTKMCGARVAEVEVEHHPRIHGKSKYGLGRIHRVIFDLILVKFMLSYSTRRFSCLGLWEGCLSWRDWASALADFRAIFLRAAAIGPAPVAARGPADLHWHSVYQHGYPGGNSHPNLPGIYLQENYSVAEVFQSEKPAGP